MDICTRLGQNLKRLRLDKGWSQEELAHQSGIHRTYVSDLERGVRNPTIKIVEQLALTLNVTAGTLVEDPSLDGRLP